MTYCSIQQAATLLRQGKLVAFPTETVYGIGADASQAEAVARVFTVKHRPFHKPLTVHLAGIHQIGDWISHFPESAQRLADRFWPGPLTLILPKAASVLPIVTAGQETVGIRIPDHVVAHQLLAEFEGGVVASSANFSGEPSFFSVDQVSNALGDAIEGVVEGTCTLGIDSTVVDCSVYPPQIVRPGAIVLEELDLL